MATRFPIADTGVEITHTELHPETLWQRGHEVFDWANTIRKELEANTKTVAPGRPGTSKARWPRTSTGRLRSQIRATMVRTGPETIDLTLASHAPYTTFVHGGTRVRGFIYSRQGWAHRGEIDAFLYLRNRSGIGDWPAQGQPHMFAPDPSWYLHVRPGGGFSWPYHLRVRGQRANPFLLRGYNVTATFHEALGGEWTGVIGL